MSSSGDAYTTFSEAMHTSDGKLAGPKQFMIKTADLSEFLELVTAAKAAWDKAKTLEKETNG
jgi:hypothetical protein